jgi:hypothetical protein
MSTSSIERSNSVPRPATLTPGASSIRPPRMPSDIRSRTKPPGVTDPARATPAFFVGASFWDSFPDANPTPGSTTALLTLSRSAILERRG